MLEMSATICNGITIDLVETNHGWSWFQGEDDMEMSASSIEEACELLRSSFPEAEFHFITGVKQLETMSLQEVFDKVGSHLLTQKRQCVNSDGDCMYHQKVNGKNLYCAIGCLIPEWKYTPSIENKHVAEVMRILGVKLSVEILSLLDDLRKIHDDYHPNCWLSKLREIANKKDLTF